jgi:hypothetical protein
VGPDGQRHGRGLRRPTGRLGRKKKVGRLVGCGPLKEVKVFPFVSLLFPI